MARAHQLVAVVDRDAKFTFACVVGCACGAWGKGFVVGRISLIMRPNMRLLPVFGGVFGMLSAVSLDA